MESLTDSQRSFLATVAAEWACEVSATERDAAANQLTRIASRELARGNRLGAHLAIEASVCLRRLRARLEWREWLSRSMQLPPDGDPPRPPKAE